MDSTSTYYAVGLISIIVATLLFIMYMNVINMDLATDEKDEERQEDRSVEYVMDRDYNWKKHRRHNNNGNSNSNNNNSNNSSQTILGKDGHGQRKSFLGKDGHGQQKYAEGFMALANDLTVKQKLQTGAENIGNLVK